MAPNYSREDFPRDADDPEAEYPYVPTEGDEVQYGSYSVDVEEVDLGNRRAYVTVRSPSIPWEGYVALWQLAEEDYDRESYPWEDDDAGAGGGDDDEDDE